MRRGCLASAASLAQLQLADQVVDSVLDRLQANHGVQLAEQLGHAGDGVVQVDPEPVGQVLGVGWLAEVAVHPLRPPGPDLVGGLAHRPGVAESGPPGPVHPADGVQLSAQLIGQA